MALNDWWWLGSTAVAICIALAAGYHWGRRRPPVPLPREWRLDARPVLNAEERQAMRLLREALPHNVILAKLPLLRLCHPRETDRMRYWFSLIETAYVSFAICSANGRVLAVIDMDTGRPVSARALQIKQGVLEACRIRYVRCRADNFPAPADLALLLRPQGGGQRMAPLATQPISPQSPMFQHARGNLSNTVKMRRAQRAETVADSRFAQDSFFAPASHIDTAANSDFQSSVLDGAPPQASHAARR